MTFDCVMTQTQMRYGNPHILWMSEVCEFESFERTLRDKVTDVKARAFQRIAPPPDAMAYELSVFVFDQ